MQSLYEPEGFYGDGRRIRADSHEDAEDAGREGLYHPGGVEDPDHRGTVPEDPEAARRQAVRI